MSWRKVAALDRYTAGPHFVEWYAVFLLVMASLVGGALLITLRSRSFFTTGVIGTGNAIASPLGRLSPPGWLDSTRHRGLAAYLFGLSYRGPGDTFGPRFGYLYDLILGAFITKFATGLIALS
ncbi:MAG: hypothetical protein ACREBZ_05815 [Thermoplasmata archaeon]